MLALIPVKSLGEAKQRLSDILSPAERFSLSEAMLSDVLCTLSGHESIDRVVVCSADARVETLARSFGAEFLAEIQLRCHGLNQVVNAAARLLAEQGVSEMMVSHGDLPLLGRDEIDRFITVHREGQANSVTLAPDRRRDGTNLLAWNPASGFRAQYGSGSFARHCGHCQELGIAATVCVLPRAGIDIDDADDFAELIERLDCAGNRTAQFLSGMAAGVFQAGAARRAVGGRRGMDA